MRTLYSATISVLALAAAGQAHAQGPQESAPEPVQNAGTAAAEETVGGDIIVTAQRRSERLQDVPVAISALGGESLQTRNIVNVADVAATVPSVNVQTRRGSGVVTIRGIGFDIATAGADPGVAIHQDGVYIARPPAALAGFFDIERVEVARGPQGTLYGRNATGGAINLISRAPTADPEGYVDATIGNFDALAVEGAISGPLAGDTVTGRLSFRVDTRDGFGKNIFNGSDVNNLNTRAVRAQLAVQPDESFSLVLRGDYFREDDRNFVLRYGGTAFPCATAVGTRRCGIAYGGQLAVDPQDVNNDFQPVNRRRFYGVSLTAEKDLGGATIKSLTAMRRTRYTTGADFDATSSPTGGDLGRQENARQFSQEFQLTGEIGNLDYIAGLYYFQETNDALGYVNLALPDFAVPSVVRQFGILGTRSYAAFGEVKYAFSPSLSLTLGGRYTIERKRIEGEFARVAPTIVTFGADRAQTFRSFSPKASLDFKIDPDKLVYVSFQKGFKSGGYAAGALTPAFRPETITSYEAGLKATWFDRLLRTNLSAFHYDYQDLQVGFIQGTVSVVTNAASARVNGFEAELQLRPERGVLLETNLSIVNAKFKTYRTGDPTRPALGILDLSGNRLGGAAPVSVFSAAQYEWDVGAGQMSLRGEYAWTKAFYLDAFNAENFKAPDSHLFNAYLGFTQGNLQVTAFVRNITNKDYVVGGFISSALIGAPIMNGLTPPRTFGVRAIRNF